MKRDDSTPHRYIESVSGQQKELLLAIRKVILAVEPDTREGIEYGMLSYPELANWRPRKTMSACMSLRCPFRISSEYPGATAANAACGFHQ